MDVKLSLISLSSSATAEQTLVLSDAAKYELIYKYFLDYLTSNAIKDR